jgi:GntR family transcriptional regulator
MEVLAGDAQPLLHHRVYRILREEIERGVLARGARLPSERVLCERLTVSRATLRRALAQLADEGLIESRVGRGTFVTGGVLSDRPLSDPPNMYRSFTELGAERGLTASARVLSQTVRRTGLDEADALRIAPGMEVFDLERLRMLDGVPTAVDRVRVPLAKAPELVDIDFKAASMYSVLEAAGVAPVRGDYGVMAVPADARHAKLLDASVGEPLLLVSSVGYDASGSVVELSETMYRGDRYRFNATLRRQ